MEKEIRKFINTLIDLNLYNFTKKSIQIKTITNEHYVLTESSDNFVDIIINEKDSLFRLVDNALEQLENNKKM